MTEPEKDDRRVIELISEKIDAKDADSGWVIAYVAMRMLPVLKDINENLKAMQWVLGDDVVGSTTGPSPQIANQVRRLAGILEEFVKQGRR